MQNQWKPIVAAIAAVVATAGAVYLLQSSSQIYAPIALLIGAILVAAILCFDPRELATAMQSITAGKSWVAAAISLGGGAAVLFALVWILIKTTNVASAVAPTKPLLSDTIGLPLIVIVGVTVLLIVIALVTYTFSVLGLSSSRDALGLPDGSVRAIIALMLLVLFAIVSIFLYNSIQTRPLQTLQSVTQRGLDDLRAHVTVIVAQRETPAAAPAPVAPAAAPEPTYTVTFRELTGPADDIAKQLIVMLGTLVTAVASFYFGSASVVSASTTVLGQTRAGPLVTTITPNPITSTGEAQSLVLAGGNLTNITRLHLEKQGEADINATLTNVSDASATAQITIPKGKTGKWSVVVNDGPHAITVGTIDTAAAASQGGAAKPEPQVPPTGQAGAVPAQQQPASAAGVEADAGAGGGVAAVSALQEAGLILPAVPAAAVVAVPASASINPAFLGHGMFLEYAPLTTLQRYAAYKGADPQGATTAQLVDRFIQAMQDMHVGTVWIQLFTASGELDSAGNKGTRELVAGLKRANLALAGWGYCYNENAAGDAQRAKNLCDKYGIGAFIADIEPGNTVHGTPDAWQPGDFTNLMAQLKADFGTDNLGMSTFGNLKLHPDAARIYRLAVNDVAFFAPQVYWYQKPPVDYMQSCVTSFRQAGIGNPLVGTAQSYWAVDGSGGVSRATMERQVETFVSGFADWGKLIGLNWYHAGNANTDASGAMSDAMIDSIAANRLNQKPYAAPAAASAGIA